VILKIKEKSMNKRIFYHITTYDKARNIMHEKIFFHAYHHVTNKDLNGNYLSDAGLNCFEKDEDEYYWLEKIIHLNGDNFYVKLIIELDENKKEDFVLHNNKNFLFDDSERFIIYAENNKNGLNLINVTLLKNQQYSLKEKEEYKKNIEFFF